MNERRSEMLREQLKDYLELMEQAKQLILIYETKAVEFPGVLHELSRAIDEEVRLIAYLKERIAAVGAEIRKEENGVS